MDYKKHYESMCDANNALQSEVLQLKFRVKALEAEKEQWEIEKIKQQKVFQDSLNNFNKRMNTVLEENQMLKLKIERK